MGETALSPLYARWIMFFHICCTRMVPQVNSQQRSITLWYVLILQMPSRWSVMSFSPGYCVFLGSFPRQISNQFIANDNVCVNTPRVQNRTSQGLFQMRSLQCKLFLSWSESTCPKLFRVNQLVCAFTYMCLNTQE